MITMINGQYTFVYNCSKKSGNFSLLYKFKFAGSLLGVLIGIFLLPQIAYLSEITSENILELTNAERQELNLNSLNANHLLTKAAYDKGQAIINTNTFQHSIDNKKFSEWIKDTGYNYSYVGENLAIDFVTSEGTVKAWLESETHKRNLLNPIYEETGVAVIKDKFNGSDTIVIVQIFGTPPAAISTQKLISDNSNLITSGFINNSKLANYNPENLLTHSINYDNSNVFTLLKNSDLISVTQSTPKLKNTFFEQYKNSNYSLLEFSIYFSYLSSLFIILYIYYLTFLYITKIS